jgi:hypothetical protein
VGWIMMAVVLLIVWTHLFIVGSASGFPRGTQPNEEPVIHT